jgi:hypothetical protein
VLKSKNIKSNIFFQIEKERAQTHLQVSQLKKAPNLQGLSIGLDSKETCR